MTRNRHWLPKRPKRIRRIQSLQRRQSHKHLLRNPSAQSTRRKKSQLGRKLTREYLPVHHNPNHRLQGQCPPAQQHRQTGQTAGVAVVNLLRTNHSNLSHGNLSSTSLDALPMPSPPVPMHIPKLHSVALPEDHPTTDHRTTTVDMLGTMDVLVAMRPLIMSMAVGLTFEVAKGCASHMVTGVTYHQAVDIVLALLTGCLAPWTAVMVVVGRIEILIRHASMWTTALCVRHNEIHAVPLPQGALHNG